MTDILTLAEARAALRKPVTDAADDADLTNYYIPAVTPIVEDITGPIISATGLQWIVDGGKTSILLPTAVTAVTSVTETGTVLVANVDYTVNLHSGIVVRGSVQQPYIFLPGQQNIVITYNVGSGTIPPNVKLGARLILRQLWQADQQGYRPSFGTPDSDIVTTPSGYTITKRAYEALKATPNVPGFA